MEHAEIQESSAPRAPVLWRDLTEHEIQAFRRDGVICLRGLYTPETIAILAEELDEIAQDTPSSNDTAIRGGLYQWMTRDRLRDFVLFGPTARPAQQALGSESLRFFYDQEFIKDRNLMEPTPWHHDYTYWPIQGEQIASIWAAMEPVSPETSALEFVAGSHLWDKRFRVIALGGKTVASEQLEKIPDIEATRDQYDILSWTLEPGDALLFHALTLHGARGNASATRKRRAITTRWIGDGVTFKSSQGLPIIMWDHGLNDGEAVSGPLFPQVLPFIDERDVAKRMLGPIPPQRERIESFAASIGG